MPAAAGPSRRSAGGRCRDTAESSEPFSTRSTSLRVSTIVPTCGCSTASTPRSAAASASRSRFASSVAHCRSSSVGRASYPSAPVAAASTSTSAPHAVNASSGARDVEQRVVVLLVQHHRREPAHAAEAERVAAARSAARDRTAGSPRAQLRRGQSDVAHLGEHPFGCELIAPSGYLAHPPGNRGACDFQCFHRDLTSSIRHRHTALQRLGRRLGEPGHLDGVGDRAGRVRPCRSRRRRTPRAPRGTPR